MVQAIIVLAFVGFLLIAAEVFVPGLILGILGGLCLLASVVLSYFAFGPLVGTAAFGSLSILTLIGFFLWLYAFPKTPIGKKLMLHQSLEFGESKRSPSLVGTEGKAITPLRPAGTALINGRRIDVITEDGFIEAGERIAVILQEGLRVVVRKKS